MAGPTRQRDCGKARTGVKVAIGSNTRLAVADFSLMSTWSPGGSSSDVWIPEEEGLEDKVYRKRQEGDDGFRKKGSVVKVSRCKKMENLRIRYRYSAMRVKNGESTTENERTEETKKGDGRIEHSNRPWRP